MPSFRNPPSLPVGKMQIACLNVSTIAARFPMPTPTRSSAIRMSNQPSVAQIRRPVILFDVMDTIVRDPFHDRMPAYFGFTFKELLAAKHPTAWIEFEKGLLSEEEFAASFFQDGREYDYEGLKLCMASGYEYLDGMATLLQRLQGAGFEMHAFSNYPSWYTMIEDKLKLSQYLPWSFVSCHSGLRKPDHQAYLDAAEHLGVQPSECIFVDDQPRNIEAAAKVGMLAIQFQNAESLEKELVACGVSLQPEVDAHFVASNHAFIATSVNLGDSSTLTSPCRSLLSCCKMKPWKSIGHSHNRTRTTKFTVVSIDFRR